MLVRWFSIQAISYEEEMTFKYKAPSYLINFGMRVGWFLSIYMVVSMSFYIGEPYWIINEQSVEYIDTPV